MRKTASRAKPVLSGVEGSAKHALSQVEGDAKVSQIPLFPPLEKGYERGICGFLCELGVLGARNFLEVILSSNLSVRTTGQELKVMEIAELVDPSSSGQG